LLLLWHLAHTGLRLLGLRLHNELLALSIDDHLLLLLMSVTTAASRHLFQHLYTRALSTRCGVSWLCLLLLWALTTSTRWLPCLWLLDGSQSHLCELPIREHHHLAKVGLGELRPGRQGVRRGDPLCWDWDRLCSTEGYGDRWTLARRRGWAHGG
jgi:hypothetical protein